MKKDFDRWNELKKNLDSIENNLDFHEREIWWCSVGVNVGREQQSQTDNFSRPILIIKRCTPDIFLALPLTSQIRDDGFRIKIKVGIVENDALILHLRSYDRRRLVRKVCRLEDGEYKKVIDLILKMFSLENEIPLAGEISEPEGNVTII